MARISAGTLWKAFRAWCEGRGESPGGQNAFGVEVKARGFTACKVSGERRYQGLQLRSAGSSSDEPDDTERDNYGNPYT